MSLDKIWQNLLQLHHDFFLDKEFDTNGNMKLSHLPDLDKDWLPEDSTSLAQSITSYCSPHHTSAHDWTLVPGGALAPGGAGCCCSPQTTQHSHPMAGPYLLHKSLHLMPIDWAQLSLLLTVVAPFPHITLPNVSQRPFLWHPSMFWQLGYSCTLGSCCPYDHHGPMGPCFSFNNESSGHCCPYQ